MLSGTPYPTRCPGIANVILLVLILSGPAPSEPQQAPSEPTTPAMDFPAVEDLPKVGEPDPLVFLDGRKVKDLADWEKRRKEIIALAQHYSYGFSGPEKLKEGTPRAEVEKTEPDALDGTATVKVIKVFLAPDKDDPETIIRLRLAIPRQGKGPYPVVLHAGTPQATVPDESGKGKTRRDHALAAKHMVQRGYAVAGFSTGEGTGMYKHYFPIHSGPWVQGEEYQTKDRRPLTAWGFLAAVSWRMRRVFDALAEQPEVDAKRIVVSGGSRYGKTALLAAAIEPRAALLHIWQGIPRIRHYNWPDRPYWFAMNLQRFTKTREFKLLGERLKALPVDNATLLAAVAPRPVLMSNGRKERGGYDASFHAYRTVKPVYEMFGAKFKDPVDPGPGKDGLCGEGPVALHIRDRGHGYELQDWKYLLDFADKHLKGAGGR